MGKIDIFRNGSVTIRNTSLMFRNALQQFRNTLSRSVTLCIVQLAHAAGKCIPDVEGGSDVLFVNDFGEDLLTLLFLHHKYYTPFKILLMLFVNFPM